MKLPARLAFFLFLALLAHPLLARNPRAMPGGVYLEKKGELRLLLGRGNVAYFQVGSADKIHVFKLKIAAQTRQEYWCETLEYSAKPAAKDLHPIFEKIKPDSLYTTVGANQSETRQGADENSADPTANQKIVLGNVEAIPEDPMPRPLPAFHKQMRFIFTFTRDGLEAVVFGRGADGQVLHFKRLANRT